MTLLAYLLTIYRLRRFEESPFDPQYVDLRLEADFESLKDHMRTLYLRVSLVWAPLMALEVTLWVTIGEGL